MIDDASIDVPSVGKVTDVEFEPIRPPFLSSREIRAALRISEPTLYRYLADGMPSHQINARGRRYYDLEEVRAWVMSRCTSPVPDQTAAS
jgi:predicted DNA-binding transcriptional regulator AlpA